MQIIKETLKELIRVLGLRSWDSNGQLKICEFG